MNVQIFHTVAAQILLAFNIGKKIITVQVLRKVDEVAYVRFASVYRQFKDINTFMQELNKLLKDK